MRIIFFINTLAAGGKERRLVELMKGLKLNSDIEFQLVVMSNDIHYSEVYDLNIKIFNLVRSNKNDASVFYKFYKICRNFQADIIHCCDSMTAIYSLPACKMLGIKLVNAMIVDSPPNLTFRNKSWMRAKLTFPFSDVIVGNSNAGLKAYNAPKQKSKLIHNGFNFSRINELKDKNTLTTELDLTDKQVVGMVASFSEKKDYKTFFKAAEFLLKNRKDIIFLAIGNGTETPGCRSLINESNLPNFRLLGKRKDVESLISVMDICVLATFTEGISNAILEYMAMGKPVIATDGGGTNEIVVNDTTGYLVEVSNAQVISEKIDNLLANDVKRKSFGEAGFLRINNYFTIDGMVDKYMNIYSSLLGNKVA